VGFFRRSATVFKISRESASSDTARASDIAPTSALKVKIALDLAARLSLPGSNPTSNLTVWRSLVRGKDNQFRALQSAKGSRSAQA
jgi:hypothetical protein